MHCERALELRTCAASAAQLGRSRRRPPRAACSLQSSMYKLPIVRTTRAQLCMPPRAGGPGLPLPPTPAAHPPPPGAATAPPSTAGRQAVTAAAGPLLQQTPAEVDEHKTKQAREEAQEVAEAEVEEEMRQLCLELATAATLPLPEEAALLGLGPTRLAVEEEQRQLCLELATAATLPLPEEAALLGLGPTRLAVEEEQRQLCLELATAAVLSPAEEAALLGLSPAAAATEEGAEPVPQMQLPPVVDPAALPQPLQILRCRPENDPVDGREATYYVLGTAHISAESCKDVASLIRAVRPQFVFLELCHERSAMLATAGSVQVRQPNLAEAAALLRSGQATPFALVYSWLLSKVGRDVSLDPGEEFRVALQEAKACGAKYVLGDRPISITMARVWAALSGWEKARLLASLLWTGARSKAGTADEMQREIERLKGSDAMTEAVAQFAKDFPSIMQPLVTERDQYMVYVLRKLAMYGDRVVAVVGAGHLAGIREHWDDEIDLDELTRLPAKGGKQQS